MSLSDLASLGSFISGIAVLFSFAFLALQLKQGNVNQRALIQMGVTDRLTDALYRRADPYLTGVVARGSRADASMPPDEVQAYVLITYASFLNLEEAWLQAQAGTMHPQAWETSLARSKRIMAAPGARIAWKRMRPMFDGAFAETIDQVVVQARQSTWNDLSANWSSHCAEELSLSAK